MTQNLWPDFSNQKKIKMPKEILEEQATYLVESTKGELYASVEERKIYLDNESESLNKFQFDFFIRSKYISNYKFKMFTINHDIVAYPIGMVLDTDIGLELYEEADIDSLCEAIENYFDTYIISGIKNEEDFKNILSLIFRTKKVKNVIISLMSLS